MLQGYYLKNKPLSNITSLLRSLKKSGLPVYIVIPCTEKSINTLPWVVHSIRKYLQHPITEIYIISVPSYEIEKYCKKENLIYINESDYLGFSKKNIDYFPNNVDRSGWIYQQLIKLYADHLGSSEHVLILDSDTGLIRPLRFEINGKIIIQYYENSHAPYFDFLKKLFPQFNYYKTSFICNMMFLNKNTLLNIRKDIENLNPNRQWWETILSLLDRSQMSSFSEYETIGYYILNNGISEYSTSIEHYLNRSLSYNNWMKRPYKRLLYPFLYKTISFQQYI